MADQSKTDVVRAGPLAMACDRREYRGRQILAGEHFQDLSFSEKRVVENHVDELLVSLREERPSDACWSAACQSEFLAEWKLREPSDQLVLCVALQLCGRARDERELHEVHQVQVAEK